MVFRTYSRGGQIPGYGISRGKHATDASFLGSRGSSETSNKYNVAISGLPVLILCTNRNTEL